ncbi:hypothetical protein [Lactococcus allomyrinae]|uniref:Uncharacterized protein n=1 Tax=Lactococcus allomyrinae TaxID=2419773 RepID=A0A387BRS5_9LACT|nr:hypothetical protein [Lactococcus allomyrinae]AYG01171.1 hypothetical protein D7I46_08715 [Lactococcus allomyrinae]
MILDFDEMPYDDEVHLSGLMGFSLLLVMIIVLPILVPLWLIGWLIVETKVAIQMMTHSYH